MRFFRQPDAQNFQRIKIDNSIHNQLLIGLEFTNPAPHLARLFSIHFVIIAPKQDQSLLQLSQDRALPLSREDMFLQIVALRIGFNAGQAAPKGHVAMSANQFDDRQFNQVVYRLPLTFNPVQLH